MLRIRLEDLEYWYDDAGGTDCYKYQNEPFTGILLVYEDEGWLSGEEEYQNGYREGLQKFYFENGNIEEEYMESNNVRVPETYKKYDEDGNVIIDTTL